MTRLLIYFSLILFMLIFIFYLSFGIFSLLFNKFDMKDFLDELKKH